MNFIKVGGIYLNLDQVSYIDATPAGAALVVFAVAITDPNTGETQADAISFDGDEAKTLFEMLAFCLWLQDDAQPPAPAIVDLSEGALQAYPTYDERIEQARFDNGYGTEDGEPEFTEMSE